MEPVKKYAPVSAGWFIPAVVLLFVVVTAHAAFSHPHVFIDTEVKVELDDKGLKGIGLSWFFDEFFSSWIIDEFDADKDGAFSEEEQRNIYEQAFTNLEHYGYFTRIFAAGQEVPVTRVERFSARIEQDRIVYSFFIPLGIDISKSSSEILIAVYDESFYCFIEYPPESIRVSGNGTSWKVDHATRTMIELAYYFGMVTPTALQLTITPQ